MAKVTTALNAAQLRAVLHTIARRADVARDLLIAAAQDDCDRLLAIEAVIALITDIGAMSDGHGEYPAFGNADYWRHGDPFAALGKEMRNG
jgi:hypothetical protein